MQVGKDDRRRVLRTRRRDEVAVAEGLNGFSYFDVRSYSLVMERLLPDTPFRADRPPPAPPGYDFPEGGELQLGTASVPTYIRRERRRVLARVSQGERDGDKDPPGLAADVVDLHRTNPGRDDVLKDLGGIVQSSLNLDAWLQHHNARCGCCNGMSTFSDFRRVLKEFPRKSPSCGFWWLLSSLAWGYNPSLRGEPKPFEFQNYKSIYDRKISEQIRKAWIKQVQADAFEPVDVYMEVAGVSPYTAATRFCDVWESKLRGEVPKHRLCLDLSRGFNTCVEDWPLRYADFPVHLRSMFPGAWLAQVDLESFYLQLPLRLDARKWFGVREPWPDGKLRRYKRVPFGLSTAPGFSSMVSAEVVAVLNHMLASEGCKAEGICYIDDFTIIAETKRSAKAALDHLLRLLSELGLPVSTRKIVSPTQCATILGVEVNTYEQTVGVKSDHIKFTLLAIDDILSTERVKRRDIHSMCGMLLWMSAVTRGGRARLRPLWKLLARLAFSRKGKGRMSPEARACLLWWRSKLRRGHTTMHWLLPSAASPRLATDASGEFAAGGFAELHRDGPRVAVQHLWTDNEVSRSIAYKELAPIVHLVELMGEQWRGAAPLAYTDSQSVAFMLLSGSSAADDCDELLVKLASLQERFDLEVFPEWRPREQMVLADLLTRPAVLSLATLPVS